MTGKAVELGEAAARAERARVRVRLPHSRDRRDRGVARRRAAPLRLARHRRDRHLEARPEPVRRRRRPPARGARRPGVGRARERAPLRAAAPRGRGREGAARIRRGRSRARTRSTRSAATPSSAATDLFETSAPRSGSAPACVASVGEPLEKGWSAPLVEGDDVVGCIIVDAKRLDDDRERLFASFAHQLSVALQKARLYAKQIEAAEIANALLEAGRELATAESPEEVLGRSVEVTARVLGTARAALWMQEESEPHDLVARASYGYGREGDPTGKMRIPAAVAHARLNGAEPFLIEAEELAAIPGMALPEIAPLGDRADQVRRPPRCAQRGARRPPDLGARAEAVRRPRAPGEARDRERRALRAARAHVRVDGRHARERARGERRVHVVARALDHRHVAARRSRARARPRRR